MAVLVTGAAGFIGAAVIDALCERGDEVVGIDNLNPYYDPALKRHRVERLQDRHGERFRFATMDFADEGTLDRLPDEGRIDAVLHLGAQAGVRFSVEQPMAYARSNLIGHLAMLEWARRRAIRHFVYASSSSVYGGNRSLPFRVQDQADRPVSLYAATKRADELMSESYAHLFRLPQTGLRFFTVYGPRGRPDMAMWLFTDALLAERPVTLFNATEMRRDFTYIDDIVAGVVAALDRPPVDDGQVKPGGSVSPHALYNLGNHRPEPLLRLIGLLEDATQKKAQIIHQPMHPGDVTETYADIDDARRDLGFAPRMAIDEGVPKFVEWFRTYHGR